MQIPFTTGSYTGKSKVADPRECINLLLETATNGGDNALCDFPGLLRKQVIPTIRPSYSEDYTNLATFQGDYERPSGVTFTMTSSIAASATGSQTVTGALSGMSAVDGEDLHYDDFTLGIYSFTTKFNLESVQDVTAAAATSSQAYSFAVDFAAGTKVVRLEKAGTAYDVTAIDATTKTFTIADDHTSEFYPGVDLHLLSHSVIIEQNYTVLQSRLSAGSTVVYVKEAISDATVDGTINAVQVYGVAYYDQYQIRSGDVPRGEAVTSIEENKKYLVVGDGYTVTYNESEYTEGMTFFGQSGETAFTDTGTGAVLDISSVDYFDWLGYKTRADDQAFAILAACSHGDSSSADAYVNALLGMQYPLADAGVHASDTGNIATHYHVFGYSAEDSDDKSMAVAPHFRLSSAMWAAIALGFYAQKYPSGTYVTQAKAALVLLLDCWIDTYLVVTEDSKHQWLFRDGKGFYDRREPWNTFNSAILPKHCPLEGNALAWCALNIADGLSLTTASSELDTLSYDYGDLAGQIKTRLVASTESDGFWHALKRRPIQAFVGLDVLSIDASEKEITVAGYTEYVLRAGDEITVESCTTATNNATYTVASVDNHSTAIADDNIIAGTVYRVIGTIVYNGNTLYGTVQDPAFFRGVTDVATYTGTGTVTKHESTITVSETISADVSYINTGNGIVIFQDKYISCTGLAAFIFFATQAGHRAKAQVASSYYSQWITDDVTHSTLAGAQCYTDGITDLWLDETEYYQLSGTVPASTKTQPWSLYSYPSVPESISCYHTFLTMYAYATLGDYANYKTVLDSIYDIRSEIGAYPHTPHENLDYSLRPVHYYPYTPPHYYPYLQTWNGFSDTAWAVIAQKPNTLFGVDVIGMTLSGRSSKNPVRGIKKMGDYLYAVIGNICVRFDEDLVPEQVSSSVMDTDEGIVTMVHNGTELLITDNTTKAYTYNSSTEVWTTLTRSINTFYGGQSGAVMDGYFISGDPESYNFYHSNLNSGTIWSVDDQSAADYKPDHFVALAAAFSELWVFCEETSEIFYNSGQSDLVFQRRSGGVLDVGCAAAGSVVAIDNSIVWLGSDRTVRRASGISPQIISTPQMAYHFETYETISDAFAFGYTLSGRKFYQITFPTANVTWVYDFSTSNWAKRASFRNDTDFDGQHRASCYEYFNGMHIVGDYEEGVLYEMRDDVYKDDGNRKIRTVIAPSIRDRDDGRNVYITALELPMETGVGLQNGQGSDPQAMLQYSDDGGKTWGKERWKTIGATGRYKTRVRWNMLGSARNKVFKFMFSDPVSITIVGNPIVNPRG